MAKDNFGGAWLVTEYVFNPDGSFAGTVRQRRSVEQVADGRLRITQECEPDTDLADHVMSRFAGTWVFDLEVHGDHRRYVGPDVIGFGTQWRPGAMTGQGLWPNFGYEFTSYGVLVADDRQLTGGFFSLAGRSVADIVGVAVPESAGHEPTLDLNAIPPATADQPMARSNGVLSRTVGPMRISLARPTWGQQVTRYSLHDTITSKNLVIEQTEVTEAHRTTTSVTIRLDPGPSAV